MIRKLMEETHIQGCVTPVEERPVTLKRKVGYPVRRQQQVSQPVLASVQPVLTVHVE
jgi:hypothetical protein